MNALTLATLPVLAGALLTTQTPAPIEPAEKDAPAPAPAVVEAPRPVRVASPFARRSSHEV